MARTFRDAGRSALVVIAAVAGLAGPAHAGLPRVPEGFRIRLVASVPAVASPCQVATAPDGSLFIAEDPMDQEGPYESSKGKILRVRDGEEPTVYAEGFRAIFGMVWRDGSLYVSHMPYLTVLRDGDGDGKAETRTELFRDLGITDNKGLNDHIVSGLQFGIDGYLYISTGDKGIYHATGPDGRTAQVKGGGVVRCRPDGTGIEVFSTGTRNHLEPNLDDRDNLFTYDNTDDGDGWWTRVSHHVDGAYFGYPYDYHDHPDRFLDRMAEYASGSPCGGFVYREDAWPEKYRGRAFWSEWGKRSVRAFRFEPKGSTFQVADVIDFAVPEGRDEFRPIDLALSYDGKTLYVADWGMGGWGNKAEKVGRVYAIEPEQVEPSRRPRLDDAAPLAAQIGQLDHPSYNERTRAQLALIRAGQTALQPAIAALADADRDPVARRHLIWVVDGIAGGTDAGDAALLAALDSKPADLRAQAARALGERARPAALPRLIQLAGDEDPSVRLQATIALGRIGDREAVPALVARLNEGDRVVAFSARQALRRINEWARVIFPRDAAGQTAIIATLETVADPGAVSYLSEISRGKAIPAAERARAVAAISQVHHLAPPWDGKWWGTRPSKGGPPTQTVAWEGTPIVLAATRGALDDPAPEVRLAAVAAARRIDDRDARPALRTRFASDSDLKVRREAAATLGQMRDKDAIPALLAAVQEGSTPAEIRVAALSGLEQVGGPEVAAGLSGSLASAGDPVPIIEVLGRLKAREAVGTLGDRLDAADPKVRAATIRALAAIGNIPDLLAKVRERITDADPAVRRAAIEASAALGDRDAVPALVAATAAEPTRDAATAALTALPDVRALPVYLAGLTDRSQPVRVGSANAIMAIRDQAEPVLTQLADRRELAPAALPELRRIFAPSVPVADWHLIGPFAADQRAPVPQDKAIDFAQTLASPDGAPLSWRPVSADGKTGAVDVAAAYPGVDGGSVFAAAVVNSASARPARLTAAAGRGLQLWLNGRDVIRPDRPQGRPGAEIAIDVDLQPGENRILLRSPRSRGPWRFAVALTSDGGPAFLAGPASGGFDAGPYLELAAKGRGDAAHGRAVFFDLKGMACSKCHAAGGQGGAVGPDLSGVGAKYPREELIRSILEPSARISSGYEPVVVAVSDGRVLTGLVKAETHDNLEIEDADARRTVIPKADIEERRVSELSLMPGGLVEGSSPRDFADLVAYLETLRDQPPAAPAAPAAPSKP